MISVVVVNYNAGPLLGACVGSLLASEGVEAEVIVVDNGSTDGSLDALPEIPMLHVERLGRNTGFAAACNVGAAFAKGKLLLFLNPDSAVEPEALARLAEAFEGRSEIGMAGGLVLNPDGTEQRGCRRRSPDVVRAWREFSGRARRGEGVNVADEPLPAVPTEVEAISGACMMLPRAVFDTLGGWDDGYFLHAEDLDLCRRVRDQGLTILFVPAARAVHRQGSCSRSRPVFVEWHKHRGMRRYFERHLRTDTPWALAVLVRAGIPLHFIYKAARLTFARARHG